MNNKNYNIVLLIIDGYGKYTGNYDWGTIDGQCTRDRFEKLELMKNGYVYFNRAVSPAVSTIMSIESILSGLYAGKLHKQHWREWPDWDQFKNLMLSDFLQSYGYNVNGFSYLLNSENWIPAIKCYKPELYKDFPSEKRDTHSHEAVLYALKHFFNNDFNGESGNGFYIVHSINIYDMWDEIIEVFKTNGIDDKNTIFIVTADHYFPKHFGRFNLYLQRENQSLLHHTDLSEYNIRVPLYIKYPGIVAKNISSIVSTYDITPTIIDILGLLDKWSEPFDGISLKSLIEGETSNINRVVRSDNIYPFQIGEKQGRITSIRGNRYKYIYRPDPPSSYISYRLEKDWDLILSKEEFYDIQTDKFEEKNLINDIDYFDLIDSYRKEFKKSNEEIQLFHVNTLIELCKNKNLTFFSEIKKEKILCIQTTDKFTFDVLTQVLNNILSDKHIDYIITDGADSTLCAKNIIIKTGKNSLYDKDELLKKINDGKIKYDYIINTSNVPVGAFQGVYDEQFYPVDNYNISIEIMKEVGCHNCATFCLDMTLCNINTKNLNKKSFKVIIESLKLHIKSKIKNFAKKNMKYFTGKNCADISKVNKYLGKNLIKNKKIN